ncbi:hypothetical protein MVEN_01948200 [Mycena venus]|uniref:Uncharacterized protein n=1 Tax=Mycena venus TaxID=2733690 RepID=A0A8H6XGY3_9AGAR|nr:hypothetical protein MVEN_01948200 [Mycena venus]
MPSPSCLLSLWMAALWRLVRAIFGHSRPAEDLEAGTYVPTAASAKKDAVVADPVPTFQPDLAGVPALILTSMAIGAAFSPGGPISVKANHFPEAPDIPLIIVTPPPIEPVHATSQVNTKETTQSKTPGNGDRVPLRSLTNFPRRVHGQAPRKTRTTDKENLRNHPSVPRLTHRPLVKPSPQCAIPTFEPVTVAEPGSADWEREKAKELQLARACPSQLRLLLRHPLFRPLAVPRPPARLPLAERLRLAVAGCASLPLAPASEPVVLSLWGDEHISFVTDHTFGVQSTAPSTSASASSLSSASTYSSSSDSIASVLGAFEADLKSPVFLGLPQFAGSGEENGRRSAGRSMHDWKELEQGDAFDGEDDIGDDHWSDVVSLEDYE